MSFTEEQKALMREMARVIISEHVVSCPYPDRARIAFWKLVAISAMSGAASGLGVTRLITAFFN